ncbi:DNA replication regulator SLD3-domain-containing protein [Scheffersomyces amazonensis]|uniref:DNA replication regulator SLD3-domain-containing protein n=1 Tax=Scheffersomyces amazonensis TaxID=1078765 RepID=UPI00315D725D
MDEEILQESKDQEITKFSPIKLPLTFEIVSLNRDGSEPLVLTVIQKITSIDFEVLIRPNISIISEENVLFRSKDDVHRLLTTLNSYYYFVHIKKDVRDRHQESGIMFHIKELMYCVIIVPHQNIRHVNFKLELNHSNLYTPQELQLISINGDDHDTPINQIIDSFDMLPPVHDSPIKENNVNIIDLEDPKTFLVHRYFETLYSLNTPLAYFPKSAMTRFRNLCDNDDKKIKNILCTVFLSVEQFDERHNDKFGLLSKNNTNNKNNILENVEHSIREEFMKKNDELMKVIQSNNTMGSAKDKNNSSKKVATKEERLQHLVLELKIREAQLQLILICELLHVWNICQDTFITDNEKKQRKEIKKREKDSKPSLVRRKSSKTRKIIPTFLGMGVNVQLRNSNNISEDNDVVNEYMAFLSMNAVLDRLGLWDTLLGRSHKTENNGTLGFLAYVLVPYYNKKIPNIIKYIINKTKDSTMKAPRISKSVKKDDEKKETEGNKKNDKTSKNYKFKKVLLNRNSAPILKRSTTSSLGSDDDLMPAFSLKRSASNLSSKNLKKRVVDMSMTLKSFSDGTGNESNSLKRSKSLSEKSLVSLSEGTIFGRKKSQVIISNSGAISQVEATPVKKHSSSISQVSSTPSVPVLVPSFNIPSRSYSQVIATPSVSSRTIPLEEIMKTPDGAFLRPNNNNRGKDSIYTKLVDSNININDISISSHVETTPIQVINSSPTSSKQRRKPGAPASIEDSPFYNSAFNGSPISYRMNDDKHPDKFSSLTIKSKED